MFTLINAEMHSQLSASNSLTAIGFDERMLLHSEVWCLYSFPLHFLVVWEKGVVRG